MIVADDNFSALASTRTVLQHFVSLTPFTASFVECRAKGGLGMVRRRERRRAMELGRIKPPTVVAGTARSAFGWAAALQQAANAIDQLLKKLADFVLRRRARRAE